MAVVEIRSSLDGSVLEDAHEIRRTVFIDEQDVPQAIEMDDKDGEAVHLVAYDDGEPVGTARIRGVDDDTGKVERVAVLASYRGDGIGRSLMKQAEQILAQQGRASVLVHAQRRVEDFYELLGYERVGEEFEEAGIPHVEMVRSL